MNEDRKSSRLQQELKKRHPFDSLEQEATLAILRTSDLLENRLLRLLRKHQLTLTQYNVLRILRGEGEALPCLEIANRMIQVAPAITRVIDQLQTLKLITKAQAGHDRRVFNIQLTPAAMKLLSKLDTPVLDLHTELLKGISPTDQKSLIRILDQIRESIDE